MKTTERSHTYTCLRQEIRHFPAHDDPVWSGLPRMELRDTVTGGSPRLATTVEAFRNEHSLFFRFTCQDDHFVATLAQHDDPIYTEDVVEVFLSETRREQEYKEFENSPANVKFDALIRYDGPEQIHVIREWDAEGWRTEVYRDSRGGAVYVWAIPFANFTGGVPSSGDRWLMNCFRIDRGREGSDEYSAWSPTEELNFHVPGKFGALIFD
ncbi:carbohydrate-binding family 9-like protein [Paenibacillus sp. HJGM_3]|uniref:carbohydrate-binding family 9-like protein n=1 Tax=Paenibacillus sp. HJGM_3 TaxID=3379816 RepID=UPI00385FC668